MKKRRLRFIRCIFHNTVDTIIWLVVIGLFVYSRITGSDVSPFLFVLIFYIYFFMFRKVTFWQQNMKMRRYLKSISQDPDIIINKYDDI